MTVLRYATRLTKEHMVFLEKPRRLNLRAKMIVCFAVLMAVGGLFTTVLVTHNLVSAMNDSLIRKGQLRVRELASRSIELFLSEDVVALKKIVDDMMKSDEDLLYVFLLDKSDNVVVHSFPGVFPKALAGANVSPGGQPPAVRILNTERGVVYDFSTPVLGGQLGAARIGLSTRTYQKTIAAVRNKIITTTVVMLHVGIIGLILIAFSITKSLKVLTQAAERITEGDLSHEIKTGAEDEIGKLSSAFKTMVEKLKRQIEELTASEQKIKLLHEYNAKLLNSMGESICVIDSNYRIEFINELMKEKYGDIVGKDCREALGAHERPCAMCPLNEVIETGEPRIISHEARHDRIFEISMFPVKDPEGKVAIIERTSDITDQIRLQKRLDKSEHLAFVGEIAASVAHEINNPLDGIQNCLDILRKDTNGSYSKEQFFDLIAEGLDRIAFIVKRLLVFSRNYKVDKTETSIADVIKKSLLFITSKLAKDGIAVEVDIDGDLPAIEADPYNLSQVIMNIVLNSAQAINGRGNIRIEAQRDSTLDGIQIDISDDGCGIPTENIGRIFDPFFTTKEGTYGTGLGLSFSKKIIEQHYGSISVCSTVGKGTTFTILLPFAEKEL